MFRKFSGAGIGFENRADARCSCGGLDVVRIVDGQRQIFPVSVEFENRRPRRETRGAFSPPAFFNRDNKKKRGGNVELVRERTPFHASPAPKKSGRKFSIEPIKGPWKI